MSVTTPEVGAVAPVEEQAAVQQVETTVQADTPEPLKATETAVQAAFNEFADEKLEEAEAAVPAEEAAQKKAEPATEAESEALAHGNLSAVVTSAPGFVKEVKAGYKTTEFWMTLAGVVLTQIGTLHIPGKYGDTIATVGLVGSYVLSRGLAK